MRQDNIRTDAPSSVIEWASDYFRHVALATIAAMASAALGLLVVAFVLDFTSLRRDAHSYQVLLVQRPFPIQVCVAAIFGWFSARRLPRPKMSYWVWPIPLVLLTVRVISWKSASVMVSDTWTTHFFGPCPRLFCADQFFAVLPLYASVAYSIAAGLRAAAAVDSA